MSINKHTLTIPSGTEYESDNGKSGILTTEIIQGLTNKQFLNLLNYRLICKEYYKETGEAGTVRFDLEGSKKSIKVKVFSIILASKTSDTKREEQALDTPLEKTEKGYSTLYIKEGDVFMKEGELFVNAFYEPINIPKSLIGEIIDTKQTNDRFGQGIPFTMLIDGKVCAFDPNSLIIEN